MGSSIRKVEFRSAVKILEDMLLTLPQVEIKTRHYRAAGLYAREITIPAGTVLTGQIHKYEHLNIVSAGRIVIATESGPQLIEAPYAVVSAPGTKRAGYTLNDTVWTTIHATDKVSIEELERELVTNDYEGFGLTDEALDRLEELKWPG